MQPAMTSIYSVAANRECTSPIVAELTALTREAMTSLERMDNASSNDSSSWRIASPDDFCPPPRRPCRWRFFSWFVAPGRLMLFAMNSISSDVHWVVVVWVSFVMFLGHLKANSVDRSELGGHPRTLRAAFLSFPSLGFAVERMNTLGAKRRSSLMAVRRAVTDRRIP